MQELDTVLPFQFEKSDVKGRIGIISNSVRQILKNKDYPPMVACIVAAPEVPQVTVLPDALALSMNSCMVVAEFEVWTCSEVTSCEAQPKFTNASGT